MISTPSNGDSNLRASTIPDRDDRFTSTQARLTCAQQASPSLSRARLRPAAVLIAKLRAGLRQHPLAKAMLEYGKVVRTLQPVAGTFPPGRFAGLRRASRATAGRNDRAAACTRRRQSTGDRQLRVGRGVSVRRACRRRPKRQPCTEPVRVSWSPALVGGYMDVRAWISDPRRSSRAEGAARDAAGDRAERRGRAQRRGGDWPSCSTCTRRPRSACSIRRCSSWVGVPPATGRPWPKPRMRSTITTTSVTP